MVRQDLIWALKNATEREESIDLAKISLINAGYPKEEVEEAAAEIQGKQKKSFLKIPFFKK